MDTGEADNDEGGDGASRREAAAAAVGTAGEAVRGATAMLQRLSGAGALPAPAAAALRGARDAAAAQGESWAACGVTPSLSALVTVMA